MVEIIAHRGASQDCLENTLDAFATALEQRADGIELDVHLTHDGQVVVHHDHHLFDRAGVRVAIADADLGRLRAIPLSGIL